MTAGVMRQALVVGASRGIGLACVQALLADPQWRVLAVSREAGSAAALTAMAAQAPDRLQCESADIRCEDSLRQLADRARATGWCFELVINTAGLLHAPGLQPEKALRQVSLAALQASFAVNAFGPILLAKAIEPLMPRQSSSWFVSLSAKVGSISDNCLGGWYAYRAAKAAQNQLLKTLAIEWSRTRPLTCVLAFHPGTTDTDLSRPFQRGLPPGRLLTPADVAQQLLRLALQQTVERSGSFLSWNGEWLPW